MRTLLLAILILFSLISLGQSTIDGKKHFNHQKLLATKGYDLVSYFSEAIPVKGSEAYNSAVKGVKYYFSNQDNLDAFNKNPNQYLPQYGGWCAYAMGKDGSKVSINPATYKIVEGKLYLFYNKGNTNTLTLWNENEAQLMTEADKNWNSLIEK